jgi:hypothetical protein
MAGINVFEGSRRIALLLKVVWVIGVAVLSYMQSPDVLVKFVTTQPDAPFMITDEDCEIGADGIERVIRAIDGGRSISAELCFKSQVFESNQQRLVPYKVEKDTMWGNGRYATEVRAYTKARAEQFRLTGADQEAARAAWSSLRSRTVGYAFLFATGGWIALSVLQALTGWIVRGFVGIPRRHDRRPEPDPQSTELSQSL